MWLGYNKKKQMSNSLKVKNLNNFVVFTLLKERDITAYISEYGKGSLKVMSELVKCSNCRKNL